MKKKLIAIMPIAAITASAQITSVNIGAYVGDPNTDIARNAFAKVNNNFTFLQSEVTDLNNHWNSMGSTYDLWGSSLSMGTILSNYVAFASSTNNPLLVAAITNLAGAGGGSGGAVPAGISSDIDKITNSVYALWNGAGTGNVPFPISGPAQPPFPAGPLEYPYGPMTSVAWYGSAMCFDSYKTPGQGPTSYGWQTAVRSDGFGTITARQFVGNLVDEVGNGNWPISDIQNDSVNEGSSIYGYVPISQDNGAWLWSPVPLPAGVTISGGSTYFEGHFYGQLQDSYGSLGTAGYVATSTDNSGDWQWTPPIDVVPDSGSAGGTCIHVKASDNGQDMYIHVDSSGTITATTTP